MSADSLFNKLPFTPPMSFKQRLLFLGPPGAGKGTQAQKLAESQGLLHLSTGDLLRAEVAAGSDLGKEAEAVMARGELVSDALVLAIVRSRLQNHSGGWLLDGFPRNVAQADALASLSALTAAVVAADLARGPAVLELLVAGGGCRNGAVMHQLRQRCRGLWLRPLDAIGIDPQQREALAFALLAWWRQLGVDAGRPAVTGAQRSGGLGVLVSP